MVFISGPITSQALSCVRDSLPVYKFLLDNGAVPVGLQFAIIAEMVDPLSYEEWMDYAYGLIDHCDLLVRLPGESSGADREVDYASKRGLPVIYTSGFAPADFGHPSPLRRVLGKLEGADLG